MPTDADLGAAAWLTGEINHLWAVLHERHAAVARAAPGGYGSGAAAWSVGRHVRGVQTASGPG